MKASRKGFYRYVREKWKTRENAEPLQRESGALVTKDMGKAEVLDGFFASVFTGNHLSLTIQFIGNGWVWESGEPSRASTDQVWEQLENLKVHKSMGPHEIHSQVLKEVVAEVARPLAIIFEKSHDSLAKCPQTGKGETNPCSLKGEHKEPRELQSSWCHLCAR